MAKVKEKHMPKWTFQQLAIVDSSPVQPRITDSGPKAPRVNVKPGPLGGARLVDFSPEETKRLGPKLTRALLAATKSKAANPTFSKYYVLESIEGLPAGNVEYGLCQALHAEEAAVAAFFSRRNSNAAPKDTVLAIITGSALDVAMPCGNCRDILRDALGADLTIVSGAANGGVAVVAKLADCLYDRFQKTTLSKAGIMAADIPRHIAQCDRLVNDAYSPADVHPMRRYHAVVTTAQGTLTNNRFYGGRDVMCEYHPIYALRDAVRQARRERDPFVKSVLILCEGNGTTAPDVMYKDRQHVMELNLAQELLSGKACDPPVYLVTYNAKHEATGAWQTSVKRWLPFPFSPRNFGPEFVEQLTKYYRRLSE